MAFWTLPLSYVLPFTTPRFRLISLCFSFAVIAILQEKFLHDRIKVNGKAGALGEAVTITRDKTKIHVNAQAPFSKRYLKYLTKKYLKKQQLRDWLHVIAANKSTYELKYYNIHEEDNEEEEEKEQK